MAEAQPLLDVPSPSAERFGFGKIWVLGFGFLGISLLWSVYDDFVPVLLQAGRPDFSKGANVQGFALGTATTGLVMGLDNLAALFILPYIGGISDRVHTRWGRRKPFIMVGAPIAAVAFALAPFALGKPLVLFMASLFITLLAMDLFRTPVVSLMPDLTPPPLRSQANGIINFMGNLGGVVATLIGGALFGVSPIAPFLLGAGGMMIAQGILLATVREPKQAEEPEEEPDAAPVTGLIANLISVLRDRDRSTVFLLGAICFWFLGMSAFGSWFSSFAIQRLNLDAGQAVQLKGFYSTSSLLCSLPCGLLGAWIGRKRGIFIGLLILATVLASAYPVQSPDIMKPLLVIAGFGWMMVVVNSLPLVLDFAPEGRIGTYTGMYYLASQTASFIGPAVSGKIFELLGNNYQALCAYTPLALIVAAILLTGIQTRKAT